MKSVVEPRDLEQFGIDPLTGESCAAGYRLLCDLTAFGRHVVADFLGLTEEGFRPNWNSGKMENPAVASIMLAHELVTPLAAWGFGMKGADAIAILNSGEVWAAFFGDGDTP